MERSEGRRPKGFSTALPYLKDTVRIPHITVNQRIPRWTEQASVN